MNPGAQPTTKTPETILSQNSQNLSEITKSGIKRSPELINAELLKTSPHTPEYQKLLQELQGAITQIPNSQTANQEIQQTPTSTEVLSPTLQTETIQPSQTSFENFLGLAYEINPEITPSAQALKNRLQSGGLSPDIALQNLTLEFNPKIQSLEEQIAAAKQESENPEISEEKKTLAKEVSTRLGVLPQSPIIESGIRNLADLYGLELRAETLSHPETEPTQSAETTEEALAQMDTQIQQTTTEIADAQNDLQEVEAANQDLEKQRLAKTKEAELITVQFQSGIEQLPSVGKKAA